MGVLCFISDLRGKASTLFTLEYDVTCGLVIYGLYYLEICLIHFVENFYHEGYWILLNAFSASIKMIIWFLSFILLISCITFIDLLMLNHPYIPGVNPTWSWCMILLMCWWILFASILLRFLHLWLSGILAYNFLFLWHPCLVWYQGNVGL